MYTLSVSFGLSIYYSVTSWPNHFQLWSLETILYHLISALLNANFDFDINIANDIAIDGKGDAVITLPGSWHFNKWKRLLHNEIKWLRHQYV